MTDTLLDRLREATEGSFELSCRVHAASIGVEFGQDALSFLHPGYIDTNGKAHLDVRRYTTNLQDALSLVPEHHLWEVRRGIEAKATVWSLERDYDEKGPPVGYHADSPAIAFCIAAIQARMS